MPSIAEIDPFDVLIASVRFEGHPEVAKPRPVVVINVDDDALLIVAIKVASHAPRSWCPGEVVLADWQSEGLACPSVARCSKLVALEWRDIKLRAGRLSDRDRREVERALRELYAR